jgi:tRNA (cytosine38-C5)-methyltransferase
MLVDQLSRLGYDYREFLLTPSQLSVPNSRLRYFLLVCMPYVLFIVMDTEAMI